MSATAGNALEHRGETTPVGLRLAADLPFEEWLDVGRRVMSIHGASSWWIGDWLLAGEYAYGRRYEEGMEQTGLAYSTLANLKYTAGRFAFSRRREKLSVSHHLAVASLPFADADRWLDEAERDGLSYHALRERMTAIAPAPNPKPATPSHEEPKQEATAYVELADRCLAVAEQLELFAADAAGDTAIVLHQAALALSAAAAAIDARVGGRAPRISAVVPPAGAGS